MWGPERQSEIFIDGLSGARPRVPVEEHELEQRAIAAMRPEAAAYVTGGAGRESTMEANRHAFGRWQIVPRVLRNVEQRDLSVELFGRRLPSPLLLAPIGVLELVHHEADRAVARAAAAEGIPMVFSNQASVPMEECARLLGDTPRFFQLYWSRSDALVQSFLARAESCGCTGIMLTLDTTMLGWRPRDLDLGYLPFMRGMGIAQYTSDPVFRQEVGLPLPATTSTPRVTLRTLRAGFELMRRTPGSLVDNLRSGWPRQAVRRFVATYSRPSLEWADLERLRRMTRLPIILKGVLHPDDARLAVEHGMDGIVVSTHGGRQVDGAIGSLDALPAVAQAVAGRMPILFDSGVRGGADVFKALALGAAAVMIGRPYVYGLALAGERGVREVLRNIRGELDLTMGLAGCTATATVTREALRAV
ncbi:MAG: lactate 2-monooxygenase [Gemmatimonadota bacterium]